MALGGGSDGAAEDVLDPASRESIGQVAHASINDLDEALDAASRGLRGWSTVSP